VLWSVKIPSPLADNVFFSFFWQESKCTSISSAVSFAHRLPKDDEFRYWRGLRLLHFGPRQSKTPLASKCLRCNQKYNLGCLVAILPGRDVCQRLCATFFASIYPLTPILHLPSFSADYDSFWAERVEDVTHTCRPGHFVTSRPDFVALLYAILFCGTMTLPPTEFYLEHAGSSDFAGKLYRHYQTSLKLLAFPHTPSLYTLAAYIFTQSQFMREEEFTAESPVFVDRVFRLAMGMGLHRQVSDDNLSPKDVEMRTKIWWHIIHLDAMTSASSGLFPLLLDEKMTNVHIVSTFADIDIVTQDHTTDRHGKCRTVFLQMNRRN
jgi:hypothetical protein